MNTGTSSPPLQTDILQVEGHFPSDAALQDAIGRLTRLGFDRAQLSVPDAHPAAGDATPAAGAMDPNTEDDQRQARTLGASTAAAAAGMVGAGLVVATGGVALAAAAAAAGAAAIAGGGVAAITSGADATQHDAREEAAAVGELILAVTLKQPQDEMRATAAMREAGARDVHRITR